MQVNATGAGQTHPHPVRAQQAPGRRTDAPPPPAASTTEAAATPPDRAAHGAVSKLGTGHFNPVAELRLTLNHLGPQAVTPELLESGATRSGQGFARAVAAYESALAAAASTEQVTDETPVAEDDLSVAAPVVEPLTIGGITDTGALPVVETDEETLLEQLLEQPVEVPTPLESLDVLV